MPVVAHVLRDDVWLAVAIAFGAVKVLVTMAQVAWPGGATELTRTVAGKALYVAGKVTPIGLVGALLIRARQSASADAASLAWALVGVCVLVAVVVALRVAGTWFGFAEMLRSKGRGRAK